MRRLTITERMLVVGLLPLLVFMLAQTLGAPWSRPEQGAFSTVAAIGFYFSMSAFAAGLAYATARSLARPLEDAGMTIDAIVRAELDCVPQEAKDRGTEIERLMVGINQLAEILREQIGRASCRERV